MSLYGDTYTIGQGTSSITYLFDKIFSNKYLLTLTQSNDNIFIGRHVLVDYDQDLTTTLPRVEQNEKGKWIFANTKQEINTSNIINGSYGWYYADSLEENQNITSVDPNCHFVQFILEENGNIVANIEDNNIEKIKSREKNLTSYNFNLAIDNNRDYDSTVWYKVYADSQEKYISIARLNAKIPSATLEIDPNIDKPFVSTSQEQSYVFTFPPTGLTLAKNSPYYYAEGLKKDTSPTGNPTSDKDEISLTTNSENENKNNYVLNISLPTIGKIGKEAWDLLYGKDRKFGLYQPQLDVNGNLLNFEALKEDINKDNVNEDSTSIAGLYNLSAQLYNSLKGTDVGIVTDLASRVEKLENKKFGDEIDTLKKEIGSPRGENGEPPSGLYKKIEDLKNAIDQVITYLSNNILLAVTSNNAGEE